MTGRLRVAGQSAPSTEFWSQNRKDIKSEEEGEIKDVVREEEREELEGTRMSIVEIK